MARSIIFGIVLLVAVGGCWPLIPPLPDSPSGRGTETQSHPSSRDTNTERWECFDYLGRSKLGTLTVDQYGTSGTVDFNGINASTQFTIQGIERRWDWGWGNGGYDYAIVINAEGTGRFYNFRGSNGGTVKPSHVFKCTRR